MSVLLSHQLSKILKNKMGHPVSQAMERMLLWKNYIVKKIESRMTYLKLFKGVKVSSLFCFGIGFNQETMKHYEIERKRQMRVFKTL